MKRLLLALSTLATPVLADTPAKRLDLTLNRDMAGKVLTL